MKLSCWPSSCWEASWVTLAFRGRGGLGGGRGFAGRRRGGAVACAGSGPRSRARLGFCAAARWCARVRWRAERQATLRQAILRQAILRQANLRQANLQASARAAPRTRRRRALRRRLAVDLAGRFVQLGAQLLHRFFQRRLGFVQRFLHALGRGLHFALELAQLVELDLALDVGLHVVDVALRAAQQVADGAGHLGQAFGADDDQGDDADHHQFSEADIKHAMAARKESWPEGAARRESREGSGIGLFLGLHVDGLAETRCCAMGSAGLSPPLASFMPSLKP